MRSNQSRALLVAVFSLGVAAGGRAGDKKDDPAPPASPTDGHATLLFPGRVESAEQTGVNARVAGVIDRINVDIGDRVKKGQALIELSAPELVDDLDLASARVAQAKAEAEEAEAEVQTAKAHVAQVDAAMQAARAAVKRAKAAADQARADADRMRKLAESNAVSQEELDAHARQAEVAKAAVEEAEAQVKVAEAARDVVAAQLAKAEAGVKAARAGVEVAQAGVRGAQTQLDFTKLHAPYDGVVTRRLIDTGAVVGPPRQGASAPLLTLMRDDVVHVVFDVDERSAAKVAVGAAAVVRVPALKDAEFAAKVTRTAGAFNPDTGTLRVEVDLPNADGKLRPGMFVNVEVKMDGPGK